MTSGAIARPKSRIRAALLAVLRSVPVRTLGNWLERLAAVGTSGYPPDVERRLKILNMIAALIAVTTGVYAVQHWSMDFETYRPIILINGALFFMALVLPALHRFGPIVASVTLVVCEYAAMVALSAYLGRNAGLQMQLFVPAAASFVVLGLERLRLIILITVVGLILHLVVWFGFPQESALIRVNRELVDGIYVQAAITTAGLIAATVWYAFRLVEHARGETDALLRNILPQNIVDRLKARPSEPIADSFEDASVLFADISGFVPLSRELGAPRVVAMLNRLVTEFDALASRHGIEKIKTIGDAYMAAGGLPMRSPDHLQRIANMALDMLDAVGRLRSETGLSVHMRIGIAAGPVMAGVIGRNKFSYDVWGDTVNLAARLESRSTPGRILLCPSCRQRLEAHFEFETMGSIDIKGIGACETWYLTGRARAA
jgi:adenylate cyclase